MLFVKEFMKVENEKLWWGRVLLWWGANDAGAILPANQSR